MATPPDRPISALPSPRARGFAVVGIILAGLAGALIGYTVVDLQCDGGCGAWSGLGAIIGGLSAGGGVAVVAVLALRAMGEWKRVNEADLFGER